MIAGKVYKLITEEHSCDKCGTKFDPTLRRFPFDEPYGIFLGIEPSGFLSFRFSGQRFGSMNGGNYEEVMANISFEVEP